MNIFITLTQDRRIVSLVWSEGDWHIVKDPMVSVNPLQLLILKPNLRKKSRTVLLIPGTPNSCGDDCMDCNVRGISSLKWGEQCSVTPPNDCGINSSVQWYMLDRSHRIFYLKPYKPICKIGISHHYTHTLGKFSLCLTWYSRCVNSAPSQRGQSYVTCIQGHISVTTGCMQCVSVASAVRNAPLEEIGQRAVVWECRQYVSTPNSNLPRRETIDKWTSTCARRGK